MVRGITSPATNATPTIPQVSFTKVQGDNSTAPAGTHGHQARSYGYNDFSDFRRPEHYIRHIEPLESELAVQVEYDMDEQDQAWLDTANAERKKDQLNAVSYETFEIIMDRLEKEWFDLTKNIPKHDFAVPSEDSTCAICDDSEVENSNAIVFCDGCNLAVHQECYGVPYIPEGQWLCRKCTVSPEVPVSCILCPNEGGAFKQTNLGDWVHLLCAIWVPETRVVNEVFMEPISGVEQISKQRWKLKCSICDIREGACIQCAKTSCYSAFHATCARKEKFLMPMKTQGSEPAHLTCFCEKHLPPEQRKIRNAAIESGQLADDIGNSPKLGKTARAYAKTYKPGPPLVPKFIVGRILQYIGKISIRKKQDFVHLLCKYWSLKREARRGAPLLKRLHLEPWTASSANKQHSKKEKVMKLDLLQRLRGDLEKVRFLAELSRKRESRKHKQVEIVHDILARFLFSHEAVLRHAFERITSLDRQDYFRHPVSQIEVPDYFDIIKNPMCWTVIDDRLDRHEYWHLQSFKNDVELVLDNAMQYNKSGTPFYKTALRIQNAIKPIMEELDELSQCSAPSHNSNGDKPTSSNVVDEQPIGDLEPTLDALDLLVSLDAVQEELDLLVEQDPFASLLNFEMPKFKPRPVSTQFAPPDAKHVKAKTKNVKRERKVKGIANTDALDSAPGFRAPRTRRALAEAAELEAEAFKASKKGIKLKRPATILPGQLEVPPMVIDVDNHQSFKMFDAGWILPPDQKRGGRQSIGRSALPPPRKRIKTGVSESQTTTGNSESRIATDNVEHPPPPENFTQVLNVDQSPLPSRSKPRLEVVSNLGSFDPKISAIVEQADGTIIIETLDTPSIRRAKLLRLKEQRNTQVSAISSIPSTSTKPSQSRATNADVEMESELSSLSGVGSEAHDEPANSPQSMPIKEMPQSRDTAALGAVQLPLEGGTLVWAKASTYPWWPAVVYEEDDEDIPSNVLKAKDAIRSQEPPTLVRFYDKKKSWQWVEADKLLMLGEKELDQELLANPSKRQKWRSSGMRQLCREAWREAIAEMEIEGEDGGVEDGHNDEGEKTMGTQEKTAGETQEKAADASQEKAVDVPQEKTVDIPQEEATGVSQGKTENVPQEKTVERSADMSQEGMTHVSQERMADTSQQEAMDTSPEKTAETLQEKMPDISDNSTCMSIAQVPEDSAVVLPEESDSGNK